MSSHKASAEEASIPNSMWSLSRRLVHQDIDYGGQTICRRYVSSGERDDRSD